MSHPPPMSREENLARIESEPDGWDVIVIGGGATGLGTAVDAVSRGYRTVLLEQADFGKGTSSRSTKLVHGGVRYLRQGNVSLVLEALRERGILLHNAPHVTRSIQFVVPCYRWGERTFYGTGLKVYDRLSGKRSLGRSRYLTREETVSMLPTVRRKGLRGGAVYYDGQFDDARLIVNLAQTAAGKDAVLLNYARVEALEKRSGRVAGVVAADLESGRELTLTGKVVVNATGVFADAARRMDRPDAVSMIRPSQGIHIVLDRSFLPGDAALMIPRTSDGRVLFGVPWHGRVVIGTTDTPVDEIALEPRPRADEIQFLLEHASHYLDRTVRHDDILSIFAGLRPLVSRDPEGETSSISREHVLHVSRSGLITITGGKWTTYRRMAEETIDKAINVGGLAPRPCITETLALHGANGAEWEDDSLAHYGAAAESLRAFMKAVEGGETRIHPRLDVSEGEVRWAVRHEMARTAEDVLSRRTRSLVLDAAASIEAAPRVAAVMAEEMGRDAAWADRQTLAFQSLAKDYLPAHD